MHGNIVKAIQQMKRPTLDYPDKPVKNKCVDGQGTFDEDIFSMAKFTWKEDYKAMRVRKDKYNENESNAWALIYGLCAPELKNKLEGTVDYNACIVFSFMDFSCKHDCAQQSSRLLDY